LEVEDPEELVLALARERPWIGIVLMGHVFRAQGQYDLALTTYERAAEDRPDVGATHQLLGKVYTAMGESELAEAEYRQAVQLDPLESQPLLTLGRLHWAGGRQETSLEWFRAAAEATPGWGQAHAELGNALLAIGDLSGAAEQYQLARLVDGDVREGVVYDFASNLAEAGVQPSDLDYVRHDDFTIDGDRRRVLLAHPDSRVSFAVTLGEDAVLAFDIAMAPRSWDRPGDGVTFTVHVESGRDTRQVFSAYIDPKRVSSDQRWQSHAIGLGDYAGQTVHIIFETSGGPVGDYQYDWAGWGEPRLVRP
jgi:tetratricopeptide (TPR) repeat protein